MAEITILDRERRLRAWFTRGGDPLQRVVDSLDIGWGGVQRWATARMPAVEGWHLDIACGYATYLAHYVPFSPVRMAVARKEEAKP
jgi:hypothetical protein